MHVGLIGYGSIAQALNDLLVDTSVTRVTVLVRCASLPAAMNHPSKRKPAFVTSVNDLLAARPDIIVECAGHTAVQSYAVPILQSGTDLIVASIGSFADDALYSRAKQAAIDGPARLILPSGAIGGLDLLAALSASGDVRVTYCGVKPPAAWKGSAAEDAADLDALTTPCTFFKGTARAAALAYPKNANVVAALALASGGFDRVNVELIADPAVTLNTHSYHVVSSACTYTITIANMAAADNPRTSLTTVLSLKHALLRDR